MRRCVYCGHRCQGRLTCVYCADLPRLERRLLADVARTPFFEFAGMQRNRRGQYVRPTYHSPSARKGKVT